MITAKQVQRIFFMVIFAEALLVAVLGYFFPDRLANGFSWIALPPLHARFVASLYAFGVVYMLGCFVAQEWSDVRWAIPLATIWTGLLFIVSLYHLDNFDFDKIPVWIWLVAYFLDPLVGLWLIWANRGRWGLSPSTLPIRAQRYLQFQGVVFILLAAGLLLLPGTMADIWAWKLDTTLAQFYAGPMLAYGLCSFLLGWQGTWSQLRVAAPAMLIFTVATLIASLKHNSLFSSEDFSDVTWFVGFGLATIAHLILTVGAYRQ